MSTAHAAAEASAPAASRHRYVLFSLIGLSLLVSSMQGSTVSVALPEIIDGLHAPLRWVGWVVTVYTLAQAVSMPIAGKLSDELGRRTVFAGGVLIFAIASLACSLAPNIYLLIAARAVQGLAGGSLLPSAYGIVGEAFEGNRAQAIGMISTIFPIGSILGPNLGGLIVNTIGWRWTFTINVPLGIFLFVAGLVLLPKATERTRQSIDVAGAVLLSISITALVYALTELSQTEGVRPVVVAASLVVAVAAGIAFLMRESKTADPILDLQLLKRREFAFMNTLNFFYGVAVFGLFSFIPLYARSSYGMSAGESGALLTPRAVTMIVGSFFASMLLVRTGYRRPIVIGMLGMAGTLLLLSRGLHEPVFAGVQLSNFVYVSGVVALGGLAFGIAGPAANNAAIDLLPGRIAAITGLRGMFRSLGGAIGTAVIVLVTSRASTTEEGLELAFLGLAVCAALTTLLVIGIPDGRGESVAEETALAVEERAPA